METEEWSIQQIAKIAGTTSRTLRHYGDIGLLPPSSIGHNGYRYYDRDALVRLQRILLLRDLGLGLPQIGEVLDREASQEDALTGHLAWLRQEQDRLERQIVSVQLTIEALRGGERLMAEDMFDGFDHTQYKDEVEQRWGKKAYADSDRWWRGMSADEKSAWQQRASDLGRDWIAAAESGVAPDSAEAQALAARHVEWLTGIPGTPAARPRRRRQGVRHRARRDVRRRRALRRELRDERRRHRGRRVRPRRAPRLRGGEPVGETPDDGCRSPTGLPGCGIRSSRADDQVPTRRARGRSSTPCRAAWTAAPPPRGDHLRTERRGVHLGIGRSSSIGQRASCGLDDGSDPVGDRAGDDDSAWIEETPEDPGDHREHLADALRDPQGIGVAGCRELEHVAAVELRRPELASG